MNKKQVIPLTKDEMDKLMQEIEKTDEYDYMLFLTLKTTGRRIGELIGILEKEEVGVKKVGDKTIYINGVKSIVDKVITKYKVGNKLKFGVKVKDIDFDKGMMKVWVLKRRNYVQDETILMPEVVRLIKKHIQNNHLGLEDYVFRKDKRGMRQLLNVVKTYSEKAGIGHDVVIHNFRHYFITEFKRRGWSSDMIVKLTGHKSSKSLSSYDHIVADDIRDKAMGTIMEI